LLPRGLALPAHYREIERDARLRWQRVSEDDYPARDALLVAEIGGMRAESRPDEELCQGYLELISLRLDHGRLEAATSAVDDVFELIDGRDSLIIERLQAAYFGTLVALERGDASRARELSEWAVERSRELEFDADLPHMQFLLFKALELEGKKEQATKNLKAALDGFEASGQTEYAAMLALHLSGSSAPEQEKPLIDRAQALAKASGDDRAQGMTAMYRGGWHAHRDEYLPARRAFERALTQLERSGATEDAERVRRELMWLHFRGFALDDVERSANEILELTESSSLRLEALEARAAAKQRAHRHALARAEFHALARALWKDGQRMRALNFWLRGTMNWVASGLHVVRLARREPMRNESDERNEMVTALSGYMVLSIAWLLLWAALGSIARRFVPRPLAACVTLIGMIPAVILFTALSSDLRRVWAERRARRDQSGDRS
jgi:hypothetical protein